MTLCCFWPHEGHLKVKKLWKNPPVTCYQTNIFTTFFSKCLRYGIAYIVGVPRARWVSRQNLKFWGCRSDSIQILLWAKLKCCTCSNQTGRFSSSLTFPSLFPLETLYLLQTNPAQQCLVQVQVRLAHSVSTLCLFHSQNQKKNTIDNKKYWSALQVAFHNIPAILSELMFGQIVLS